MKRIHHDSIDSTNAEAQRLARLDVACPLLITAYRQSSGRGRSGRIWQSPLGGAWMSLLWKTRKGGEHYQAAPMVAGIATLRAIARMLDSYSFASRPRLEIKWPNDVLLDGRKVAGILCESVCSRMQVTHLIVGVGVNVDFPLDQLQGQLRHPPTTLREVIKSPVKVDAVVNAFESEIMDLMARFESEGLTPDITEEIRDNLAYVGSIQTWRFGAKRVDGMVVGINSAGKLLLDVDGVEWTSDHGELSRWEPGELLYDELKGK